MTAHSGKEDMHRAPWGASTSTIGEFNYGCLRDCRLRHYCPKGYEGYVPGVVPLLQKHGAEILVADYEGEVLEGKPAGVNVVLKFPSEEAARNWYNDPEYGPVKQIRLNSTTNGSIVMAKEFKAPPA